MTLDDCRGIEGLPHEWRTHATRRDTQVCAECGARRRRLWRPALWRILLVAAIARGARLLGDREIADEIDELVQIARIRRRLDREVRSR